MSISKSIAALSLSAGVLFAAAQGADAATRIQKTFGDWKVDCTEREDGRKNCALQVTLVTKKDKRVVFGWTIGRETKDSTVNKAVMRTPNGVLLSDGVSIGFEGAEPVRISYLTCGPQACVAEFDFTDQWVKALSSNEKLVINYKAVNKKQLKHEINLKQFGAAFDFYSSQIAGK